MKQIPKSERPREKALMHGIESLSNRELLALLIRSGTANHSAFDIADDYDVEDVYNGLMRQGADICLKTLDKIIESNGYPQSISQDDLIVKCGELHHAPKIFKETCMIDWTKNVKQIYDLAVKCAAIIILYQKTGSLSAPCFFFVMR